jgi:hypothetical protein
MSLATGSRYVHVLQGRTVRFYSQYLPNTELCGDARESRLMVVGDVVLRPQNGAGMLHCPRAFAALH